MQAKPRILVIEDSASNMELFRDLLGSFGMEVIEATEAASGFQMAAIGRPDVILLDLQLPDVDGLVTLRALKSDERTAGIPTIVVTAHAVAERQREALAEGAEAFLTKPIDFAELRKAIEESLSNETGVAR